MKLTTLLLALFAISLSSCYKKLYQECQRETLILNLDKANLGDQHELLLAQQQTIKGINDSLRTLSDNLAKTNRELKQEKVRLEKIEEEELRQVVKSILLYFNAVAKLAIDEPPPCFNAANGHFRNNMVKPQIQAFANPQLSLTTHSAIQLLAIFRAFSGRNQAAFINNSNYAPPGWNVFRDWLKDHGKLLGQAFLAIWNVIAGNDRSAAEAAVNAAEEYKKKLKQEKCNKDYHANGWISAGVLDAAHTGLHIKGTYDYTGTSQMLQKIVSILENCFVQLTTLQTKGHEPWLNGEWQLRYYAILKATAWALEHMDK